MVCECEYWVENRIYANLSEIYDYFSNENDKKVKNVVCLKNGARALPVREETSFCIKTI